MWQNLVQIFVIVSYMVSLSLGAKLVVDNTVNLARRFGVSDMFIGLTVVAFGTDLPELFLSISGAISNLKGEDSSGVIIGNAIGSSICQISIIIGVTGLFHYLSIGKKQIKKLAIELLGSSSLLFLVGYDGKVSRIEGITLIIAFLIYLFSRFFSRNDGEDPVTERKGNIGLNVGLILFGFLVVIIFSEQVIHSALYLSDLWQIKQSFVGAVIVGLGTSLPELAISITAIIQKKPQLSVGNIIGSNIFDLLIPIGVAAAITPLRFPKNELLYDLPFLTILTILVIWLLTRIRGLQKNEGVVLIVVYLIFALIKYIIS